MRVTVVSSADCEFCRQAHEVLERFGRDFPLDVETVDLRSPRGAALARQGGIIFPPGVFLDGEAFSYGRLSERKLRRELQRRLGRASREQ